MIAALMLYALAVSLPICVGSATTASLLRRFGRPERGVWLTGIVTALAVPLWAALETQSLAVTGAPSPLPTGAFAMPDVLAVSDSGLLARAGMWLLLVWFAVSATLALRTARILRRLDHERSGWRPVRLAGREVLLSSDLGPAVYGVRRPEIVLPDWMLKLSDDQIDLIVRHEHEHIRARDPWMLASGLVLNTAFPWHVGLSYLTAGLRQALEVDCDRRVTSAHGDVGRYGETVLTVAALGPGRSAQPLPAFTESTRFIKRRLLAMTRRTRTLGRFGITAVTAMGVLALTSACEIPLPTHLGTEAAPEEVVLPPPAASEATGAFTVEKVSEDFTPFTAAPKILNQTDIIRSMSAEYPPLLRDAGIGGTIQVYVFVDETGTATDLRIHVSSGHQAFDDAALRVARSMRFTPAMDKETPVAVWISMPITFQTRGPADPVRN